MKTYFNLSVFFCFALFSAQESDEQKIQEHLDKAFHQNLYLKEIFKNQFQSKSSHAVLVKKNETENGIPMAEQDFDLEIRAILDYRLSRVLREDLFCLVCEGGNDEGQLA